MGPTVALSGSPEVMRVATVASSRTLVESNFRELDDVFLQTQTRIWLGEVLQKRLHEQIKISDLLVDGELLFEVSKVIWKMLFTKKMELRHLEAYKYEPFASRKSGGRYMPYSNVASFLKICKIMGLSGIDLFSPSDVVEKRNTRKVCMCIRSLSKKARARYLNIPDFDIVTYTVAMPTDMVGYIRRSLELSQCSLISSGSPSSSSSSRPKSRQKRSVSTPARNYDSYSDESDEAESKLTFLKSCSSSSSCNPFKMKPNLESTVEISSLDLNSYNPERKQYQSDSNKPEIFRIALDQSEPSWSNESIGSVCSQHDDQPDIMSNSSRKVPEIHINSGANSKAEDRRSHGNSALDAYLGLNTTEKVSTVSNATDGKTLKRNHSAPQLSASDVDFHCTGSFLDREGGICSASSGAYSHGLCQMALDDEFKKLSDVDFVEVSSNLSMNSLSSMVFNIGFDDLFHLKDDIRSCEDSEILNQKYSLLNGKDMSRYNSQEKNEKLLDVTSSIDRTDFETKDEDINVSTSLHLSRDADFFFSCYNEDCVASGPVNDTHDEVKLFETDSESFKSVNSDLDSSMLIESYSHLDLQIWDQKDQCRSKESGGKISHGLIMLEGVAGAQCQGTESFAGRPEEQSPGHVESVSKTMEEPNRYLQMPNRYFEMDSESFKSINSDLDNSMLIESYSPLDLQILDQKDHCRSKESGDKRSNELITLEAVASAQCQGIEYFAGRQEEPSPGHVESVSKIKVEPNRYLDTCSSTGDIEYGDLYYMSRTIVREDIEASSISGTCNGFEQDDVIPVISSKYTFNPQKVAISSRAEPTADEYISPAFGNADNSSIQDCRNVEVVDDSQVESSDEVKDQSLPAPERKPQGKALLKNLLKGTAVIGTLIFLVQMRRSIKHGTLERKTQSIKRQEGKGGKLLSHNRQRVDKIDSLYPAEKLKF